MHIDLNDSITVIFFQVIIFMQTNKIFCQNLDIVNNFSRG